MKRIIYLLIATVTTAAFVACGSDSMPGGIDPGNNQGGNEDTDTEDDNKPAEQLSLDLIYNDIVTTEGLYYEGKKGTNYQFGPQMTPHGDCITYFDGYIYFGWWRGGVDKRNLMLSRMKIGSDEWETIEFPETHDGYQGNNPTLGDSHCTVAVGICPIDKTIHLVYDIHSYFITYKHGYFKYKVSAKNATEASKDEWNSSLFTAESNELNSGRTYERSTYPDFQIVAGDKLMLKLRFGGTGRGNTTTMLYDGNEWGLDVVELNSSRADDESGVTNGKPVDERYSIYGDPQYLHGKYHFGFAIRTENTSKGYTDTYKLNQGLYYASTDDPSMRSGWKTLSGENFDIPFGMPDKLLIAQPCPIGGSMSSGPVWTVTASNAKHFIATADGKSKHYYTAPGGNQLSIGDISSQPSLLSSKDGYVFGVFLDKGKLHIDVTKEGTNSWKALYIDNSKTYALAKADMVGDKIVVVMMENSAGDARPIRCVAFNIK